MTSIINNRFSNASVAVTGAAGTIGQFLVTKLLSMGVAELKGIDNNETSLFALSEELEKDTRFKPHLGDVRDGDSIRRHFSNTDFVFHAAAYKHVPMCEVSPFSAVATNVYGVENVIKAAQSCGVKRTLLCSSDKAVNPTNVMGASKLLGERLFSAANGTSNSDNTCIFASTRFGNVAGSSGSVIPIFAKQISNGGPVTLTTDSMTRFVMTIDDATDLLLRSITLAQGGEVFVARMPGLLISDLAAVMIDVLSPIFGYAPQDIEIIKVGAKPGEKNFEEILTSEEIRRTVSYDDLLIIQPPFTADHPTEYNGVNVKQISTIDTSENTQLLIRSKIEALLMCPGVLDDSIRDLVTKATKS